VYYLTQYCVEDIGVSGVNPSGSVSRGLFG
jgi:hypothetical protein